MISPVYVIRYTNMLQSIDVMKSIDIAETFYHHELNFHRGNHLETHKCLKQNLGTNENTNSFYQLLSKSQSRHWTIRKTLKNSKFNYIFEFWENSILVLFLQTAFKITVQLIVYSWDLMKDIYFLILYNQFFPISRNAFDSFGFQTFFILLLSILIPNVLNFLIILSENSLTLSGKEKLVLILSVFVSQSVIGFAINKIHMLKEKLQMKLHVNAHSAVYSNSNSRTDNKRPQTS